MRRIVLFFFVFCFLELNAQYNHFYLGRNYFSLFEKCIYSQSENHFTSFKPVLIPDLMNSNYSILDSSLEVNKLDNWFLRKLYNEHLFNYSGKNFSLNVSPVININFGKEFVEQKKISVNTRGYIVEGYLGNNISFFSSFLENQSVFPNYLNDYIKLNRVVPGQGYARGFKENGFDYAKSSGYVLIRPSENFVLQFGHGKHFIGDGYRSLLLSDNSFNYPFLRLQTNFGRINYTNLYTEFMDINYFNNNSIDNFDQIGYPKKYMSAHYLTINLTKKINISLFESVIWRVNHAPGTRGFDINYLNPVLFLRPVEFSMNSPDNVLVGVNVKYIFSKDTYLYNQIILDEFSLNDLRKKDGFWGNKYGYQIGCKKYNIFNITNLTGQIEYNYVRPYTYAHNNPLQNYAHYNQPLAHPLGANFSEWLFLSSYRFLRWELEGKIIFAKYGGSISNDLTSYGNNLYMSTGNFGESEGIQNVGLGRPSDFNIYMYQGNLSELSYKELNLSYLINPKTNLKLTIGIVLRDFKDEEIQQQTKIFNFGFKSDLFNNYYDF